MTRDSRSKEPRKKGGLGRGLEALFEDEPQVQEAEEVQELDSVSYTHLTLPTIYSV